MRQELQNKLFKKYPKIFVQKDLPMTQTCMCWGIDCGNGWYNLVDILCAQVNLHFENIQNSYAYEAKQVAAHDMPPARVEVTFEATQVKEKFGGLRFYYQGGDDYIDGLVDMAEAMSYHICDICGAEGKCDSRNGGSWLVTRCDKHRATHWYIDKEKKQGDVAIDFDGVINSYKSGFVAIDNIPDPPVEGSFEFIEKCLEARFRVHIYSTRNKDDKGRRAICRWMGDNGMSDETLSQLKFPIEKPIAKVYIDDRAWEFRGQWPSIEEIAHFEPWHGGKSSSQK